MFINECSAYVLFVLDCCYAAALVQSQDGSSILEAIVASGFGNVAPLHGNDSFTMNLITTLAQCRANMQPVTAARLCGKVTSRLNSTEMLAYGTSKRTTPHHIVYSSKKEMIIMELLEGMQTFDESEPRYVIYWFVLRRF